MGIARTTPMDYDQVNSLKKFGGTNVLYTVKSVM